MRISDWSSDVCSSDLAVIVEDLHIDQWLPGATGRSGLGPVILVEIAASTGVGFGQAISQQRETAGERLLDLGDMIDRARRAARGKADRKTVGSGKSVSVRVYICRRASIKKKNK